MLLSLKNNGYGKILNSFKNILVSLIPAIEKIFFFLFKEKNKRTQVTISHLDWIERAGSHYWIREVL